MSDPETDDVEGLKALFLSEFSVFQQCILRMRPIAARLATVDGISNAERVMYNFVSQIPVAVSDREELVDALQRANEAIDSIDPTLRSLGDRMTDITPTDP